METLNWSRYFVVRNLNKKQNILFQFFSLLLPRDYAQYYLCLIYERDLKDIINYNLFKKILSIYFTEN